MRGDLSEGIRFDKGGALGNQSVYGFQFSAMVRLMNIILDQNIPSLDLVITS